jgi:hypothetical protein
VVLTTEIEFCFQRYRNLGIVPYYFLRSLNERDIVVSDEICFGLLLSFVKHSFSCVCIFPFISRSIEIFPLTNIFTGMRKGSFNGEHRNDDHLLRENYISILLCIENVITQTQGRNKYKKAL